MVKVGQYHDLGNRLNHFLRGFGWSATVGGISIDYRGQALVPDNGMEVFPPDEGELEVVTSDGRTLSTSWTMLVWPLPTQPYDERETPESTVAELYEKSSIVSIVADSLNITLPADFPGCGSTPSSRRRTSSEASSATPASTQLEVSDLPDASSEHGRRLAATPKTCPAAAPGPCDLTNHFPCNTSINPFSGNCAQFTDFTFTATEVYHCTGDFPDDTMVDFYYDAKGWQSSVIFLQPKGKSAAPKTVTLQVMSFKKIYEPEMTQLMALAVSLAGTHTDGKLLIDLTGNGGGSPEAASVMIEYLFGGQSPNTTPYGKECQWLTQKASLIFSEWNEMLQKVISPVLSPVIEQAMAVPGFLTTALKNGLGDAGFDDFVASLKGEHPCPTP